MNRFIVTVSCHVKMNYQIAGETHCRWQCISPFLVGKSGGETEILLGKKGKLYGLLY